MRWSVILIGLAIPMLLTATVFAAPGGSGGNFLGIMGNTANNAAQEQQKAASSNELDSSSNLVQTASAAKSMTHNIVMSAEKLSNGLLAYKMVSYKVTDGKKSTDITSRYPNSAIIPGPTIVLTEGDSVNLIVQNHLSSGIVGVHVHGVHYDINSDATLEHINGVADEGATPGHPFTYHWVAGPGTAGSWPYHDHTFGGLNGAETKGLYGMVIVNPASGTIQALDGDTVKSISVNAIKKDFVLYMGDDAFWATEILPDGTQKALWTNPTLVSANGQYARFNIIALGTDLHQFKLNGYSWLSPGTETVIDSRAIGPLENHVFVIKAKIGTSIYEDLQTTNHLEGMKGKFKVTPAGGSSVASPMPAPF